MKTRLLTILVLSCSLLAALALPAGAVGEAYSTEILPDSCQLLRVDVASGAVTEIGAPDTCQLPVFLARSPSGELFGVNAVNGALALFRVDLTTAALTKVGDLGVTSTNQAAFGGLTFDPTGKLWFAQNTGDAACSGLAASCLYSLDPTTGHATLVGGMGADADALGGLAADCSGLFAATSSSPVHLLGVDTATGAATDIGPTGVTPGLQGMAFDTDGVLHALGALVAEGPFHVWAIDPATGVGTEGAALTGYASNPFDQGGFAMTPPSCPDAAPLAPAPVTLAPAFTG